MTFKCNCGKKVDFAGDGCYNVGEAANATGWKPLFVSDGSMAWLCQECTPKAVKLAKELIELIGDDSLTLWSIAGRK